MNFYVARDGTILHVNSESVRQFSVGVSKIYFIYPAVGDNLTVTCAFRLPNGETTPPSLMTYDKALSGIQDENENTYSTWQMSLKENVTQYYGEVHVQFFVYDGAENVLTTAESSFNVTRGVGYEIPDKSDSYDTLLNEILNVLTSIKNDYATKQEVSTDYATKQEVSTKVDYIQEIGNVYVTGEQGASLPYDYFITSQEKSVEQVPDTVVVRDENGAVKTVYPNEDDDAATKKFVLDKIDGVECAVPTGGTKGQVLAKASDGDYQTEWIDNPIVAGEGEDTAKMVTVDESKANTAQGYRNLVTGQNNQTDEKTYQASVSGCKNTLSDCNNSIVAGLRNHIGPTENNPANGSEEESEGVSEKGADNCVVAGYKNSVLMQDALVVGDNNTVTNENGGSGSIVGGAKNTVKAGYNIVCGSTNTVEQEFNAVFGRINTLGSEAGGNIVGGERNSTNAGRSVIGGLNNQVDHSECGVFGRYLQTGRADQLVCGRYNEPDENAMFIVGYDAVVSVGTRTNIFTVNKNGTATVYKDPVKNLDVATKQYVDNAISNSANDVATKEYVDNAISNLSVGGTSEIKRYLHRIVIDCSSNEGVIFYFAFINNNSEPYTFEDYTFDESDFPFELLFKNFKIEVESETLFGFITESYYSGRSLSLECYINEAGYASFYIDLGSGDSITDDVFEIV